MAVYLAIIEADQPGSKVRPILTTRNPEILALVKREIDRYLSEVDRHDTETTKSNHSEAGNRG